MNEVMDRVADTATGIEIPAGPGPVTVPIHEAKSTLSRLVKRAIAGETIYIGAYGKPEVMLVAANIGKYQAELRATIVGCMKGKLNLPEGWDDPLDDELIDIMCNSMQGLEDFEIKGVSPDEPASQELDASLEAVKAVPVNEPVSY